MQQTKFILDEKAIPESWYNLVPDLPFQLEPPLNPATMEPVGPESFAPIFPQAIIEQEVTQDSYVPIPKRCVRSTASGVRPRCSAPVAWKGSSIPRPTSTTSTRAALLPAATSRTPPSQAYYNREEGVKHLTTETGAGQWGSSLAFACGVMDLDCTVYMVRVSYDQKPYRRIMMET